MEKRLFATREKHGDDWKLYLPLLNYMHVYEKKYIREIICTAKIQIIKKKKTLFLLRKVQHTRLTACILLCSSSYV